MTPEEVQNMIQAGLPDCDVKVEGDGSHFEAIVIGDMLMARMTALIDGSWRA